MHAVDQRYVPAPPPPRDDGRSGEDMLATSVRNVFVAGSDATIQHRCGGVALTRPDR